MQSAYFCINLIKLHDTKVKYFSNFMQQFDLNFFTGLKILRPV